MVDGIYANGEHTIGMGPAAEVEVLGPIKYGPWSHAGTGKMDGGASCRLVYTYAGTQHTNPKAKCTRTPPMPISQSLNTLRCTDTQQQQASNFPGQVACFTWLPLLSRRTAGAAGAAAAGMQPPSKPQHHDILQSPAACWTTCWGSMFDFITRSKALMACVSVPATC